MTTFSSWRSAEEELVAESRRMVLRALSRGEEDREGRKRFDRRPAGRRGTESGER
jgi:hypothetical protein